MSKQKKIPQTSIVIHYPEKTTGSETAAAIRKQVNGWSEGERVALFERGMQIIYGGSGTAAPKVRS